VTLSVRNGLPIDDLTGQLLVSGPSLNPSGGPSLWVPLTVGAHTADLGAPYYPAASALGSDGVVRLRGAIASTAATTANEVLATLTAAHRPAAQVGLGLFQSALNACFLFTISAAGQLQSFATFSAGAQYVVLDGMSFPLRA